MQAAEEGQDRALLRVVSDDPRGGGIVGEAPAELRVELGAAFAVTGLLEERVADGQLERAAFACSATALNAAGSVTARSASILRSSSMSAFRQPATNWL